MFATKPVFALLYQNSRNPPAREGGATAREFGKAVDAWTKSGERGLTSETPVDMGALALGDKSEPAVSIPVTGRSENLVEQAARYKPLSLGMGLLTEGNREWRLELKRMYRRKRW
jgi:hypothetical protein